MTFPITFIKEKEFFLSGMKKREMWWVAGILIFVVVLRLILAFSIPHFTYESYFHLRQVEHITQTGFPLYEDPWSYGGRELRFLPFFHYFMALFDLFLPLEFIAKVIPNLLLASLTILTYIISRKITLNFIASLFSSFIAGFLPILFNTNAFTVESLFLPVLFLAIFSLLNLHNPRFLYLYLACFLVLSLTSSATFLIIVGFGIYGLLSFMERKKVSPSEKEVMLLSLVFYLWIQFLFFKKLFLSKGITFIWQNIPSQIILQYFPTVSLLHALILVSILPFLAGIFVVYRSLFHLPQPKSFLLISFAIATSILSWFRLIEFTVSLAFFGVILAILFSLFYGELIQFLQRTKFAAHHRIVTATLFILLIVTLIYPALSFALSQDIPQNQEVNAAKWLQEYSPPDSTILALLEQGHLVTYYAHRKNFMDDQFGSIPDIDTRFDHLNTLFATTFETQAISLADLYGIDYVMVTPAVRNKYGISGLKYLNAGCFQRIYREEQTRIYGVKCTLLKKGGES